MSCCTNLNRSRCSSQRFQSNQLIVLFWQYALLFPYCVRLTSSPISRNGVPTDNNVKANKFLICLARNASISGEDVAPSSPQFQERLSSEPSMFCCWFISLCFRSKETRSLSVNPSWQVTKLMLCSGGL